MIFGAFSTGGFLDGGGGPPAAWVVFQLVGAAPRAASGRTVEGTDTTDRTCAACDVGATFSPTNSGDDCLAKVLGNPIVARVVLDAEHEAVAPAVRMSTARWIARMNLLRAKWYAENV